MSHQGGTHGQTTYTGRSCLAGRLAPESYQNPQAQHSDSNGTHGSVSFRKRIRKPFRREPCVLCLFVQIALFVP